MAADLPPPGSLPPSAEDAAPLAGLPPGGAPPPPAPIAGPPRRRRRWFRRLAALLLLILLLVVVAASWFLENGRLGRLLGEQLSAALHTEVQLRVDRRGLGFWELRDIALGEGGGERPFLELDRLGLYARPGLLLQRRVCVDSLVVEGLRLNLAWRDSLVLPAWLLAADSSETPDTSGADPLRYVRMLAERGWSADSVRVVLRDLRLGLHGHQQGAPLDLDSPPFDLVLTLPRLDPAALIAISRRQLPPELAGGLLAAWSGRWRDTAPGASLRPLPLPANLAAELAATGLGLARAPELRQELRTRLQLSRDTLRLDLGLEVHPEDLSMSWERRDCPLPARLAAGLDLAWPIRANPIRADLDLSLELEGGGLDLAARAGAALRQRGERWDLSADWRQELALDLGALAPQGRAFALPRLGGSLDAELTGGLALDLALDSAYAASGGGSWWEELVLASPALDLPEQDLSLRGLELSQRLEGDLDLADPLPRRPRLDLRARLAHAVLHTPPVDDPRQLTLRLTLAGEGPGDSLRLAADLAVADWFDGRVDLSAAGRLPSLAEWAADYEEWLARPQRFQELPFRLDVETSLLNLEGIDPSLWGGVRSSARVETGRGLRFTLEAVPGDLAVAAAGRRLDLPLHRLEVEGGAVLGDLYAAIPWPDTLWAECRPDPLPPLTVRMGRRDGELRALARWQGLAVPRLLAMLPPEWQPAGVEVRAGTASLDADLRLALDGTPLGGRVLAGLGGGGLAVPGWTLEGLDATVVLDLDTLGTDWSLDLALAGLRMAEPAWSWEGFSLSGAGRLDLPFALLLTDSLWLEPGRGGALAAGGDLRVGLASLDLAGTVAARLDDWRGTLPDLVTADLALGGKRQLRPWPGVRLNGRAALRQRLERRGGDAFTVSGLVTSRLDSLDWQQEVRVEDLRLDLPFAQDFTLDADYTLGLPVDQRRQPVDWNALRGWDRRQPDFHAPPAPAASDAPAGDGEGRGWPLRIARACYDEWSVESFAADLRVGQGRLDIPEFRFGLFGGGVRGGLWVVGLDSTSYALDCSLIGLDSRYFEFGDRTGGRRTREAGLVNAVLHAQGSGLDLGALDQLRGQLRMPELDRQVTLNLLRALDAQGVDPSIGKVRRLLELPGFRYRVERVDFDVAHGFARPRVALRKSLFSPLPDVAIPMSPLPLGFMIRNFALAEEETP